MKIPFQPSRQPTRIRSLRNAFTLLAFASLASTGSLLATSSTYTNNTSNPGDFDTAANWAGSVIPGVAGVGTAAPGTLNNTDTATFFASGTTVPAGTVIPLTNTHNLLNITTAQGGGSLTIGAVGGPAFYLTDAGTITLSGNLTTIAAPLNLQGSYTFSAQASASRVLTVSGAVNGNGVTGATLDLTSPFAGNNTVSGKIGGTTTATQSLAVIKDGVGNWVLSNTANTYTGGTTINAGTLFSSVGTGGASLSTNMLGSGGVTMTGGTLALTFNSTTVANTFNNALTVAAGNTGTIILRTVSPQNAVFAAQSVTGTGTIVLAPNAGATGTTINAGLGRLANGTTPSATGAFGAFGGTIQVSPNNITNGTTTLNITDASALGATTGTLSITTGGILTSTVANINSGSAVTVAGGTITPNGTSVGTLTLASTRNFSLSSGTLGLTLNGTTAGTFDQILGSGTGTFSLTGGTLDLSGVTAANGNSYQIFSGFASGAVSGLTITDYATGDGSLPSLSNTGVLTFAAVPEPAAYGQIVCLGLIGTLLWLRPRRQRKLTV